MDLTYVSFMCVLCVQWPVLLFPSDRPEDYPLTQLYSTQRVRKNMQYNRNYLRLWFRCWSSPYLFSLILSLTIEIYFSPINKLHSVPQVLIPILIEMFLVVFLFGFPSFLSFSCVVSCSHAPCNFGSIKKTWAIPYISK